MKTATNIFHDSEKTITDLRSGRIPRGSIIRIQHPSGNSESVRFHGWSTNRNAFNKVFMVGCNMGWDNGATTWYDLDGRVVSLVEQPKENDQRWA